MGCCNVLFTKERFCSERYMHGVQTKNAGLDCTNRRMPSPGVPLFHPEHASEKPLKSCCDQVLS